MAGVCDAQRSSDVIEGVGCSTAGPAEIQSSGGTVVPTAYPSLGAAFAAIVAGTHTGVINVFICANTLETATATLTASGVGAASYTSIVVRPSGANRIVEGTVTGAIIRLNGADNVTIDGRQAGSSVRDLTVRNNSTLAATAAIWLSSVAAGDGASNNVIRNLEIAAGQTATTGANATFGAIMSGAAITVSSDGEDNDNNQFLANRFTRARYGLVTRSLATNNSTGLVIADNIVGPAAFGPDEIGKVGIFLQGDTGAMVSRNTVQFVGGTSATTTAGADRCGICVGGENWGVTESGTVSSSGYTVERNIIHDIVDERTFSVAGIRLGTTQAGAPTNNLVANNFIYNVRANGTAGDQAVGIGYAAGHTDRIVFNSISMTGDMDPAPAGAGSIYGNALRVSTANGANNANLTLMDNSVYLDVNSNTATVHFYAITLPSSAYAFGTGGLNFNNYYINAANPQLRTGGLGTNSAGATTTEFQTLANWQAALAITQDANSIQADPLYFSNTSNLHIQPSSPNINVGTAVAGIANDIDGQARPNGAGHDIGADEFVAAPGTLQFSSATYTQTEQGLTATITVTRAGGINGAVSVNYATVAGGSATGGVACGGAVDYVNAAGTLNWADLDFADKTFTVTLCNDGVPEGDETVNLALSAPTGGATLGSPSTAVLTIRNSTAFGGGVNVGAGQAITSLTNPFGLFDQINNGSLSANTTATITSDLTAETGSIALNQFTPGFTLTIKPDGVAPRLVAGGNATVLLDFNGADGVTIDGINAGSGLLRIRNNAGGIAIRFINDASNNTVSKVNLESGSNSSTLYISTGVTTGNDNITIDGNIIRDRTDAAGVPFNAINLIGTSAAISNSNITINNNQIINFLQAGIVIGTSDNVTFTLNDIFQTAPRGTSLFGLAVNSADGTNLFSRNTIHDLTTSLGTTGMAFNASLNTTVSRNSIFNFPSTSGSTGVLSGIVFNGATGSPATLTVVNNMVSIVPAFTNNQSIFGIRDFAFAGNTFTSYFNTVLVGGTGTSTANTWACQRGFSAPTAYTMIDNICFNNRTGGGNHFAAGDQSSGTGTFVSNYNIFVGTGLTPANFFDKATSSTAVPVNFATWQAGPPTRDANSQASNPGGNYTVANMFVSANDLHLINAATNPASNAGIPVVGFTTDFDGQFRSPAAPEIGADEFTVTAAGVSVSGRVLSFDGRGLTNAKVTLTDQSGGVRTVITGRLGSFRFDDVEVGQSYTIQVLSRRFSFAPRTILVNDELTGVDFYPDDGR